jgi:hypothetical protein
VQPQPQLVFTPAVAPTNQQLIASITTSAPTTVPLTYATVTKDNFKPTPRDKQNKNVYDFARLFLRATKDKAPLQVETALVNIKSNDSELHNIFAVRTASGPSHLGGTPDEWFYFPRFCNLKSLFLRPTTHIEDVKNQLLGEQIDYYTFQLVPWKWVSQIWERLRTVRAEDVGHSNEQFILTISYILEQLDYFFKIWKISDQFYEEWKSDGENVPNHVGLSLLKTSRGLRCPVLPGTQNAIWKPWCVITTLAKPTPPPRLLLFLRPTRQRCAPTFTLLAPPIPLPPTQAGTVLATTPDTEAVLEIPASIVKTYSVITARCLGLISKPRATPRRTTKDGKYKAGDNVGQMAEATTTTKEV